MLNMTVFLMTVMQGLPATDQTPIISMYYAIIMAITTAATVTGVMILSLHHKVTRTSNVSFKMKFLLYPGPRGGRRSNLSQKSSSVSWEKSQKI